MRFLPFPLGGDPPVAVPIPRAPVVRVLAQARFPPILMIRDADRMAGFQEAIRETYPILGEERVAHLVFAGPDGAKSAPGVAQALIRHFHDRQLDWQWRVSLAVDYVAIETRSYKDRRDFLDRLRLILATVEKVFYPAEAQRLGLRYVYRLTEPAFGKINDLLNPAVLGIAQSSLRPAEQQLITQAVLDAEEGQILCRWGHVPERSTIDPEIEPLGTPSWVIDLDMFTPSTQKI